MGKGRGKLTPAGRKLLVERITKQGYPVARAAGMQGVSRSCAYQWVRRWRAEGETGLEDRSCRPHTNPRCFDEAAEQRILAARARFKLGLHQLAWRLGLPRSTV